MQDLSMNLKDLIRDNRKANVSRSEKIIRIDPGLMLEKLDNLFAGTPTPIVFTKLPERTLSDVNEAFLNTFSFSRSAAIGKSMEELGILADPEQYRRICEQLEAEGIVIDKELRVKNRKGAEMEVFHSGIIIENRGARYFFSVMIEKDKRRISVEKLRNSEELLILLTRNMSDMIRITDLQGTNFYVSPSHLKSLGYSPEELVGKKGFALIHPDDFQPVMNKFIEGITDGKHPWRIEYRVRHARGHYVWFETVADFLRNEEDKPIAFILSSRDISVRKEVEEKLFNRESYLSAIIENQPGLVWLKDRECRFLAVNKAFALSCGKQKGEDLVGKTDYDIWPLDLAHKYRRDDFLTMEEGKPIMVEEMITNRGETRWFETFKTPVVDGQGSVIGTAGYARDITDRKRAEKDLIENIEKYRLLADNSKDLIWTMTLDGHFTYFSPSIKEVAGFTQEEAMDMTVEKYIYKDDVSLVLNTLKAEIAKSREERSERYFIQVRQNTKHGVPLDVEISAGWLYNELGELIGVQGSTRDVSARKKAEEERAALEQKLLQAQKMQAIGTLAGGIAHDFNNMLTTIQGYISLIRNDIGDNNAHGSKLDKIEEQIKSGANLTSQLLGFARGGKYEVKTINPNDLLKHCSDVFGRTKKQVAITNRLQRDIWTIEADPIQIEQTLLNMFINSWQAMPDGGDIYLRSQNIVLKETEAMPHGVKPGKYVMISITDTGTGIDDHIKKRIFEPFFTTKKPGQGTGLGLASAYGIVKNHDGFITVDSEKGRGSTFKIYLPASEKLKVVEDTPPAPNVDTGKGTILLVDDEKEIVAVTRELLESRGFRVLTAGSGQEAVTVYMEKKKLIDLVILDMIMPTMGGSKTFDMLHDINADVKVLLASGYSIDGEAQRIIDKGCKGFIQKPFRITELTRKIGEIL